MVNPIGNHTQYHQNWVVKTPKTGGLLLGLHITSFRCPHYRLAGGECQFRSGQERAPVTYNFTLEFRVFEDEWTVAWISMDDSGKCA